MTEHTTIDQDDVLEKRDHILQLSLVMAKANAERVKVDIPDANIDLAEHWRAVNKQRISTIESGVTDVPLIPCNITICNIR